MEWLTQAESHKNAKKKRTNEYISEENYLSKQLWNASQWVSTRKEQKICKTQKQEGSGILIIVIKRKEQINVNEEAESFK